MLQNRRQKMRNPLKLRIMKKIEYSPTWKRFVECDKIMVDNYSPIKTEAQLCKYIFEKHGDGRFMVLAWQKGVEGFWCFWLGFMRENGFIRDVGKNKELANLRNELKSRTVDYEERELIEEEIDMEKRYTEEVKTKTRRGPIGLIKFRPGQMHNYQEF